MIRKRFHIHWPCDLRSRRHFFFTCVPLAGQQQHYTDVDTHFWNEISAEAERTLTALDFFLNMIIYSRDICMNSEQCYQRKTLVFRI